MMLFSFHFSLFFLHGDVDIVVLLERIFSLSKSSIISMTVSILFFEIRRIWYMEGDRCLRSVTDIHCQRQSSDATGQRHRTPHPPKEALKDFLRTVGDHWEVTPPM